MKGSEIMVKTFDLNTIVVEDMNISFFYKRENNDIYGNPRYRVYMINSDAKAVIEKIAKTYDVKDWVRSYIKNMK
jgi:hypothetical protein